MRHPCSNGRPAGNGWNSPVNNAKWGTDYLNRTGTAKSNMYDNRPEETKYIYTDNDSQGKQLAGENYEDPKNLTPAVAHLERTKIYPLNGEVAAKPMKFPDASGVPVNMLPISDGSAFQQLKRLVDSEGDNLAGPDWLGMLAAIGIVKDQLFAPDAHAKEILDQAAKAAYKMSRVIGFEICMATIGFSGFQWEVRAKGQGGPGPNIWDNANALVDDQGRLHLKITSHFNPDGYTEWRCVELSTLQRLGLGRYQFQVIGRIDKLDRNVVLGLFKYPTPDVGTDGTNEIDIEFAQWGRATARLVDSEGDTR